MGWQKDRETEGKGVLNRLKCSKGAPNVFQTAVIEFRESLSGFLCVRVRVRVRVYACVYVCVYLRVLNQPKIGYKLNTRAMRPYSINSNFFQHCWFSLGLIKKSQLYVPYLLKRSIYKGTATLDLSQTIWWNPHHLIWITILVYNHVIVQSTHSLWLL